MSRKRAARWPGHWNPVLAVGLVMSVVLGVQAGEVALPNEQRCTIQVRSGGWGGASPRDIEQVLNSVLRDLRVNIRELPNRVLLIQHGERTPITLFEPGPKGECVIELTSVGNYWAQYAYQFAHELCHVFANHDAKKDASSPNQWFEETLCETSSLFALRRMAVTWKTAPPYPHWADYAPHLATYADEVIQRPTRQLPEGTLLMQWFFLHKDQLRRSGVERELNGVVANRLLPLFEQNPQRWDAVRYLNLGEDERRNSFAAYLASWRDRVPQVHRAFVGDIMTMFGYPADVSIERAREF